MCSSSAGTPGGSGQPHTHWAVPGPASPLGMALHLQEVISAGPGGSFLGSGSLWPLLQRTVRPLGALVIPEENQLCVCGSFGNKPREVSLLFVSLGIRICPLGAAFFCRVDVPLGPRVGQPLPLQSGL